MIMRYTIDVNHDFEYNIFAYFSYKIHPYTVRKYSRGPQFFFCAFLSCKQTLKNAMILFGVKVYGLEGDFICRNQHT